jgi:UPF0042 nucleotide-binding protein
VSARKAKSRATRRTPRPRVKRKAGKKKSVGRFLVVTGMSGAGKSHAIRALEDLGYYCIDNLPTPLIPVMADLSQNEEADTQKIAVVADVRERSFIREFPPMWRRLKASAELDPMLVFLEASDAALLRRYSETRRPHPLAPDPPDGRPDRRHLRPHRARAPAFLPRHGPGSPSTAADGPDV